MRYNSFRYTFQASNGQFPFLDKGTLMTDAFLEAKLITQASDGMLIMTQICSMSTALQGSINVEIPTGKISPVSIMGFTIADSGERKSSVENLFTKGMKDFQKEQGEGYETKLATYSVLIEMHMDKRLEIKRRIKQRGEEQCEVSINELIAHDNATPIKPQLPKLIYEDSTPEALLIGLKDNLPNAFIGSSEGGVLLNSRVMAETAYINAIWSGDNVTINRKTTDSFVLNEVRLSAHIMVQFSALDRYMKKSKDDVRGNGFLSRFLVCAPASTCGYRQTNGFEYSKKAIHKFNQKTHKLLKAALDLEVYTDRQVVVFCAEAKDIWLDIYNDIESKMAPNGPYEQVKDHASKLPENIARLAAVIHYFDNPLETEISKDSLLTSINLVSYFSSHFMQTFSPQPKYVVDAINLEHWLCSYRNSGVKYLRRNYILQYGPNGIRKKQDLESALNQLKLDRMVAEIIVGKTKVIDLFNQYNVDADRLNQDMMKYK